MDILERAQVATGERAHVVTDPAILYFGTPVVLLSTVNPDGRPNLAPISSVFWLRRQAILGINRNSQSWANLDRTREVAVALPSAGQADAVNRLALTTGRDPVPERQRGRGYRHVADKFGISGLTPVAADLIAPPLVAECPVVMECTVDTMHPGEDRLPAVEVTVRRVHAAPEILVDGRPNRIDPDRWRPLIMSFQQFYGLADGRLVPSRLATVDEELYRVPAPAGAPGGRPSAAGGGQVDGAVDLGVDAGVVERAGRDGDGDRAGRGAIADGAVEVAALAGRHRADDEPQDEKR